MVTIIDAVQRTNGQGEAFTVFILTGGVEMVKSQKGKFYATVRKTNVPCTLEYLVAKQMIGQKLPGSIVKRPCDPYAFTTQTGEEIELDFTYEYTEESNSVEEAIFQ